MADSNIQETDMFSIEDEAELENAFDRGGIEEVRNLMVSKRDEWKSVPVNIAVTGKSGVGKSTLINTFRGLTAEDKGAAHADVKEATRKITKYKHPKNENIVFWDLPGVGTRRFPKDTYLKDVDFERYDVFMILSSERCTEVDLWLCNEVKCMGKMFYFVRTKMQNEVSNYLKSHPKTGDKKDVIKSIHDECEENFTSESLPTKRIFLIDSFATDDFDFDKLSNQIIDELPRKQQEALTLSLTTLTKGILQKKKALLQSRIKKVALLSAIRGAIPIPGINAMFDAALTKAEIMEYRNQFDLPSNPSAGLIHSKLQGFLKYHDESALAVYVGGFALKSKIMAPIGLAFRILGGVADAAMSYRATVLALQHILDDFTEEIHTIDNEFLNEFNPSI